MSNKLLPCPFCGTQPVIGRIRDESLWSHDQVVKTRVECGGCDIATDYTEEGQDPEAIEKWNTRAASPAPVPDEQAGEWQWVPKEPTHNMRSACHLARAANKGSDDLWAAMLASAPSRPVAVEKREPLTPERILELRGKCIVDGDDTSVGFCRLIEAEHGITGDTA